MLLTSVAEAKNYDHLFIAPHLDDVALSCGGFAAGLAAAGYRVLIVTICTAGADPSIPLQPFAQYLHDAWHLGDDPMLQRRQEDEASLCHLGVDGLHYGERDAVYRLPDYGLRDAIFGDLVPNDRLIVATTTLLQLLMQQQPWANIYLPLAVGNHVDHQAVWAGYPVLQMARLTFYEDFPYAGQQNALTNRLAAVNLHLVPDVKPIDRWVDRKVAAVLAYSSQMTELFGTVLPEQAIRGYARHVAGDGHYGERLWYPRAMQ
ncbi:MAG: PIG-L family deacetylase [Herpetosiphon sp.]